MRTTRSICEDHGGEGGTYVMRRGQGRKAERVVAYRCPQCRREAARGLRAEPPTPEGGLW